MIKSSINFNNWKLHDKYANNVLSHNDSHNNILADLILRNRGVNIENKDLFLDLKLKSHMVGPYVINNMHKACELLYESIELNQNIGIISDYDVDGATSLAIITKFLNALGKKTEYYIPSRYTEGYGANNNIILHMINDKKCDLLILLDNGSSLVKEVELVKSLNKKIIIIDHHVVSQGLMADALVNPNDINDKSNLGSLCTAGLVFFFIVAFRRFLYDKNSNLIDNIPNVMDYIDLVALGTICDLMPLIGLNRAYVNLGIKKIFQRKNIGLRELYDALNINTPVDKDTIAFFLGPCLNAGSRMGHSDLAFKLLVEENESNAKMLADRLKSLNNQRKELQQEMLQEAKYLINTEGDENINFVGKNTWNKGLVGIVASKLNDFNNKPSFVYALDDKTNIATVSGRSVNNISLTPVMRELKEKQLLVNGGGHAQAVGFSFTLNNKQEIIQTISRYIAKHLVNYQHVKYLDAMLSISACNMKLLSELKSLEPFGMGFKEPIFCVPNVSLTNIKFIGKESNHASFFATDGSKKSIKVISFNILDNNIEKLLKSYRNELVDLIVEVKENIFQGKHFIQLHLIDVCTI